MSEFHELRKRLQLIIAQERYDNLYPAALLASTWITIERKKGKKGASAKPVTPQEIIGKRPKPEDYVEKPSGPKQTKQTQSPQGISKWKDHIESARKLGVNVPNAYSSANGSDRG